jgi:hypothetical protein
MTALSVAEVLDAAADLIEPDGAWTQGDFGRRSDGKGWSMVERATDIAFADFPATCFCLYGAVAKVAGVSPQNALAEPFAVIREVFNTPFAFEIAQWNDAPERTQAEVVAKLREAAAFARESTPQ